MFVKLSQNDKVILDEVKNLVLIILVLLDLLFISIMILDPINTYNVSFFIEYDNIICLSLFLNLIYEYKRSNEKLTRFIQTHILDILAIIPYNFIFLRYFAFYRIFRIIQVISLFKIWNVRKNYKGSFKYFVHHNLLKVLTLILILYIIFASYLLTQVDASFTSIFDSFWYNIISITTVGYGDIIPISDIGKLISIFSIVLGSLFISVFTAAMSSLYGEKNEENTQKYIENKNQRLNKRIDKLNSKIKKLDGRVDELSDKMDYLIKLLEEDKKD